MDFLNILGEYKSELGNETATSEKLFSEIIGEVKKYDAYDIIARIAGLNLIPENQNKAILLDAIISELLCLKHEEIICSYKMSSGKFRKIISQVNNSELCMMIDPNENTFVQNVIFHKNHTVFNGIDQTPAYNIQNLIKILFEYNNDFSEDFLKRIHKIYSFILGVSDGISKRVGTSVTSTVSGEERVLVIPVAEKVQEYSEFVTIDGDYFNEFFENMDTTVFFSDFGSKDIGGIDHRPFYARPFLRNKKDNSIIILNISSLPTFAFYLTIKMAEDYGINQELISLYHRYTWRECREYLNDLGHYKIAEDKDSITLINETFFKEMIVTVYNNQLMLVLYLADDGEDYNEKTMHAYFPNTKHQEYLDERLKYYTCKFQEMGTLPENVMLMLIISGFGRGIGVGFDKSPSLYDAVNFTPIELKCVSIMERKGSGFLPRYIRAKNKLNLICMEMFSELNTICIYTNNQYSFYMADDIKPVDIFIEPGHSIDYIKDALIKEDRKRILSFEEGVYAEVIVNDKKRNIYRDVDANKNHKIAYAVCFDNCIIWLTSDTITKADEINLYHTIIDAITYWLAECKDIINLMKFPYGMYHFSISISGKCVEYYYNIHEERKISELVDVDIKNNHVNVIITPCLFRKMNQVDNSSENELCKFFIEMLNCFSNESVDYDLFIEEVFKIPMKKKIFSLDYISKPYLKPFEFLDYVSVHEEDEDYISDWIGKKILQSEKWSYGMIPNESRGEITNYIVGILYDLLEDEVQRLNPKFVVEVIYLDLEKTLYRLMLARERYIFDVSCYPEKNEEILCDYNSDNRTSIALKFLMEYIAAKPPKGTKILGIGEYEYLLAICSMIIDWAYKNDLFYYNIFNTPVEILKSERVGMKQKEFADMFQYGEIYKQNRLNYISSSAFRTEYKQKKNDYEQELDAAFESERGYTYKDFVSIISGIIVIGETLDGDICIKNKVDLVKKLVEEFNNVPEDKVKSIVSDISIKPREDFLKLPKKYRKEDVYPWRFNRTYSFNRRPLIERENDVIWGNRQLYHMLMYVTDLIYNGMYLTKDKKMATLIGKISNERGKLFNETIYLMLKDMRVFNVYSNLKKINRKPISDENKNTLGDIDILFVDLEKLKIYVTEVKSFSFSRNPYEIQAEYNKIFVDSEQNKCFVTKHNRRVEWVKNHLNDVCIQFNLDRKLNWEIIGIFVVEEPIISNKIYDQNIDIISQMELTVERIRKIK